ncbi:MAG: S24 family peptidase [Candidatus Binatia bacterium]
MRQETRGSVFNADSHYENSRPRQYYPDFIVTVREADGREVMWLAETKGEIRPNTFLKRHAAEAWCEKMSGTSYGPWRYLFVQQRKFEAALSSHIATFAQLVAALAVGTEPQLRLVPIDDERIKKEKFKTLLPLYSLKAAAGYFGNGEAVEPEAWIQAEGLGRLDDQMFVARAVGRSMEPRIHDGDYCLFRAKPVGTRQGKIVLAEYRGPADPDTGGSYTVKRYSSEKIADPDGGWQHERIILSPLNPEFQPIVLAPRAEDDVQVVAELITLLGKV